MQNQTGRVERVVLFAIALGATLTISFADPLWNWVWEGAVLLLAAIVCLTLGSIAIDARTFVFMGIISIWGVLQLALGWTVYPYATLDAVVRFVSYGAVAFIACVLLRGQKVETWLRWFTWSAVVIALVAVLAYQTSYQKILWVFPAVYPDNWGPFASRNNFAQFLELSFPVAVYQFAKTQGEARWIAALAPAILFAACIRSASRAGAIILVLEAVCLAILLSKRTRKALIGLTLAATLTILLMGSETLLGRLRDADPLAVRREVFRSSISMIRSRPWTGFGLGTYMYIYPEFAQFDPGTRIQHAHNDWLEWASEGGIFFAIAWLALAISVAGRAVRSIWGIGILAVFVHALVDYPFAKFGMVAWFFALLGCLVSGSAKCWNRPFFAYQRKGTGETL